MTIENVHDISGKTKEVDGRVPLLWKYRDEELGNDKVKRGSFYGSVFNLSCTIVGCGIMSLPATLKILGVVPAVALIMIAAFLAEASIEILLRFSKPGSSFSYADVVGQAFGTTGRILVQASVVVNNVGGLIVYVIIIGVTSKDVLSGSNSSGVHHAGVLEGWFGEHWWTGRAFVLAALTLFVIVPLISFKRIDSLRFTSAISIGLAILFLLLVVEITVYRMVLGRIESPRWFPQITDAASFLKLFTTVPVVVFAYICHHNVHTIESELDNSPNMRAVVQSSLALCTLVYIMTGLFGYLLFGDSTLPDMLSNFDTNLGIPYNSIISDIARISYAVHIVLVYPIIFYPMRLNLDGLLFPSACPLAMDNLRFAMVSLGLIVPILLGAIFIPSIWVAFEFTGATVGALIAFIFPASIALKDTHGIATRKDKIVSVVMIILAVFSNIVAIYSNAHSLLI